MSEIISQCPKCSTSFRVGADQLSMAGGKVRCGFCMEVFQADAYQISAGEESEASDKTQPDDESVVDPSPPEEAVASSNGLAELLDKELLESEFEEELSIEQLDADLLQMDRQLASAERVSGGNSDEDWALELLAELETDSPDDPPAQSNLQPALDTQSDTKPDTTTASDSDPIELESEPSRAQVNALANASTAANERAVVNKGAAANEGAPESEAANGDAAVAVTNTAAAASDVSMSPVDRQVLQEEPANHTDSLVDVIAADAERVASRATDADLDMAFNPDFLPEHLDLGERAVESPSPRGPLDWRGLAVAFGLVLVLCLQYVFFYWNDLITSPSTRPMFSSFCTIAGCDLPEFRDLKKVKADQLTVRSHTSVEGALTIDVIVTNNSAIDQPFPVLQLTFFNMRNVPVATRRFFPDEYLDGELRGLSSMPSKNPVRLALEVFDPGEQAVNYELTLLPTL